MSENIPHSLGGFRGAFESEHGRKPTEQEIWNAAIRSWRDLTKQKSDVAKERVVDLLLEYAGDNGYSHIDYADTMRHAAALLQSTALPASDMPKIGCVQHDCAECQARAALPVGELTDGKPLPCPFCGHVGLEFKEGSTFRWIIAECGGCGASRGETRIQTFGEGTRDEWMADVQADAIQEWNTRAILAAARSQPVREPEIEHVNCDDCTYHYKDADQKPCNTCIHSGDFVSNFFEPRHGITQGGKV